MTFWNECVVIRQEIGKLAMPRLCAGGAACCFVRQGDISLPCEASGRAGDFDHSARRPIKPVYIRKLVRYIDAYGASP
jgi:hypothetical protein